MKRISLGIVLFALLWLAACSQEDSLSSSEILIDISSSTEVLVSSSSKVEESSSSSAKMSSSAGVSSSEIMSSSMALSSSSALQDSLYEWSWDVPKEARLNPDIAYDSITDARDGKVYKTVAIGDQVWMAENLNYADSVQTASLLERSWCFDDVPEHCDVTGRLYTWAAAIDSVALANDAENPMDCGCMKSCNLVEPVQGICPDGWHLPSREEWLSLIAAVGENPSAVLTLRSSSGWGYANGSNTVGFTMLPGGQKQDDFYISACAYFWTSSTSPEDKHGDDAYRVGTFDFPKTRFPATHSMGVNEYGFKASGMSVRCVKD